jgi:hypothetical protein
MVGKIHIIKNLSVLLPLGGQKRISNMLVLVLYVPKALLASANVELRQNFCLI